MHTLIYTMNIITILLIRRQIRLITKKIVSIPPRLVQTLLSKVVVLDQLVSMALTRPATLRVFALAEFLGAMVDVISKVRAQDGIGTLQVI